MLYVLESEDLLPPVLRRDGSISIPISRNCSLNPAEEGLIDTGIAMIFPAGVTGHVSLDHEFLLNHKVSIADAMIRKTALKKK